jgi:hypothetical protein
MISSNVCLKNGPSRENLFDALRLGPTIPELQILNFWGQVTHESGAVTGSRYDVKIEGLYGAGDSGRDWFFWGKVVHFVFDGGFQKVVDGDFCFGRWNTHQRQGTIEFSQVSFFTHPVVEHDSEDLVQEFHNYDCYKLSELPRGRYEVLLLGGTTKSVKLEIQPYGKDLMVRTLSGDRVKVGGRPIESSQWTLLQVDREQIVRDALNQMIEFV